MSFPSFNAQPAQAERIRAAIVGIVGPEVGWTVRAANRLGVARSTVSTWVCGHAVPSTTAFVSIAAMTGTTLDWLVRGKEPP